MRPRGYGRIVVTTSLAATKVEPVIGSAYMAAKAGARHFVHCLALELAADGITANAIAPGFFVTNIGGGHAHDPDLQAMVAKDIPMHRVGQPDDVKALALFLAVAGVGVHHRPGDRDRRRLGPRHRRLKLARPARGAAYSRPVGALQVLDAGTARDGAAGLRRDRARFRARPAGGLRRRAARPDGRGDARRRDRGVREDRGG